MLLLVTSLSYPSTLPFLWLIAGMTRTALKGRQEHTAMVTVGLVLWHLYWNKGRGGNAVQPPRQALLCSSVNPLSCHQAHAPHPPYNPRRLEALELILCFQGIKTGQCVVFNGTHRTCEIWSWCPVESGAVPRYVSFFSQGKAPG